MEIKEAVEIIKNEQLDIFDGRYDKAFKAVREALRNGYTLCKVDEAVDGMCDRIAGETEPYCFENHREEEWYRVGKDEGFAESIEILKEACK